MALTSYRGSIGTVLAIPETAEIGAVGFAGELPFEFRLLRNGKQADLPMAIAALGQWQTYEPRHSPPCYTTLYPIHGGTRGLDATGLSLETKGLLFGHPFTLFVHGRY